MQSRLWVADYSMRNAGDLDTATDRYPDVQAEGARLAKEISLSTIQQAFVLSKAELKHQYFDHFEAICNEIKSA